MNEHDQLYVLDTDTVSLIQRGREGVRHRIETTPPEQMAVTVVTVVEQMRGWLAEIHRAKEGTTSLIYAYQRFQKTVDYYCGLTILPFDDAAAMQLAELRKQKIRMSTQDVRIAAITLAVGGILISCNIRDFSQVPNLVTEDWSQD
ncbi:type II toxin-antitoxin system VapC family toxin [Candidatus Poribacteria bacterium]|nr:type II toxin-antitoxin system VapC family toxin [Candidatus Poribacteria bacterium]